MTRVTPGVIALLVASLALLVTTAAEPRAAEASPGAISGEVPQPGQLGLIGWSGGALSEIRVRAEDQGCTPRSVWANGPAGGLIGHIYGAPTFVNEDFLAAYPGGVLPELPLLLVCAPEAFEGGSPLDDATVISFYGYPGAPVLGALGSGTPQQVAARIDEIAATYDGVNGSKSVKSAFHIIVALAQASPGADGTYLGRIDRAELERYIEVARARDMLVFIDVQIGWADPLAEVQRLEWALLEPFVHLALDPEFNTRARGEAPGQVIGSLDAVDVNRVQRYLASLVRDNGLPTKLLMLHQFDSSMLTNPTAYEDHEEIEVVIDMDGFAGQQFKLEQYFRYGLASYAERNAIKLFFLYDTPPLLGPQTLFALERPPQIIIYQ